MWENEGKADKYEKVRKMERIKKRKEKSEIE